MKPSSYFNLIWQSFIQTVGFTALGILVSLVLWVVNPDSPVPLRYVVPTFTICLALILTFIQASYRSFNQSQRPLPKVILGREPFGTHSNAQCLCLLEPSELFSHDSYVAFYILEEGKFERLIGIGAVLNIQSDGFIQAELLKVTIGSDDIVARLKTNDKSVLDRILVKPNAPRRFLEEGIA